VKAAGQPHSSGVNGEAAAIPTAADNRLALLHTTILDTPTRASVTGTEESLEIDGPLYQPGSSSIRSSDGTRTLEYRAPATGHAALYFEGR
jgi:hypothetical protein